MRKWKQQVDPVSGWQHGHGVRYPPALLLWLAPQPIFLATRRRFTVLQSPAVPPPTWTSGSRVSGAHGALPASAPLPNLSAAFASHPSLAQASLHREASQQPQLSSELLFPNSHLVSAVSMLFGYYFWVPDP